MGCRTYCAVFVAIVSISVVVIPIILSRYFANDCKPPPLDREEWWGKGDKNNNKPDSNVYEFPISLTDGVLKDLNERLSKTRFFENLDGIDWEYGINPDYMRELTEYWKTKYDWRKQEKILNTYKHYKTKINGIKIHFLHFQPELREGQRIVPIMLVHGWPGSFYEFYKVIPKIVASSTEDYAFSIICPSIPGYGFSEAPHKPGFEVFAAGRIFSKLMARLGYESYYIQGGDWGSAITCAMALMDPSHIRGLHLNMFPVFEKNPLSYIQAKVFFPEKEQQKIFPLSKLVIKILREGGYLHLQATRPNTVALANNDSPAGLAAYLVEKFAMWSGCATNDTAICLESCFTKDEMLTNVMIYWATHSIASSMRLYYETMHSDDELRFASRIPVTVPSAIADFPHELFRTPEPWIHNKFTDIVQFTEMPRGGHFAAFEEPELFAADVIQFVAKVEKRLQEKTAEERKETTG